MSTEVVAIIVTLGIAFAGALWAVLSKMEKFCDRTQNHVDAVAGTQKRDVAVIAERLDMHISGVRKLVVSLENRVTAHMTETSRELGSQGATIIALQSRQDSQSTELSRLREANGRK